MPTDSSDEPFTKPFTKPFVQAPAQSDSTPVEKPAKAEKPKGVVSDPRIDYDKFRGQGGDYIVNEEGHRVPLKK